jgi:hypothetical protein
MNIVKHLALGAFVALVLVTTGSPAQAGSYSGNHRVAAHVTRGECHQLLTGYEISLVNRTPKSRRFHVVTRSRGVKMSDQRITTPGRSTVGVGMDVPSARSLTVTVRFRGEALVHRQIVGICRY